MRLRAHLTDASTEPPWEWVVSRVCEEFACLPSRAVRELEDADADLVFTILELRAFAQAKHVYDQTTQKSDLKMTPAMRRVLDVEVEALKG